MGDLQDDLRKRIYERANELAFTDETFLTLLEELKKTCAVTGIDMFIKTENWSYTFVTLERIASEKEENKK